MYENNLSFLYQFAARHRRHLTDAQKVKIALKYKADFEPQARAAMLAGVAPNPPQNLGEGTEAPTPTTEELWQAEQQRQQAKKQRETNARAAAAVGLSRETFRQGQVILEEAPEAVKDALHPHALRPNLDLALARGGSARRGNIKPSPEKT